MNRLAKWIIRLYPAAWRARYGDEVDALLADSGSDARVVADLLQGGIRMRISMWSFSKLAPMLAIGGMLAGFGASFLVTPVYASRATMQMTLIGIDSSDVQEYKSVIDSDIVQIMTAVFSRTSLEPIIEDPQLQLYSDERRDTPLEDVIEKMKRNIFVQFVRRPGDQAKRAVAFDIVFTYPDRFHAQQTVEALMNRFDEQNQAMQMRQSTSPGEQLLPSGENLDVLDTASLPVSPAKPDRFRMAGGGLLAGLLVAIVIAIIRRIRPAPAMSLQAPTA